MCKLKKFKDYDKINEQKLNKLNKKQKKQLNEKEKYEMEKLEKCINNNEQKLESIIKEYQEFAEELINEEHKELEEDKIDEETKEFKEKCEDIKNEYDDGDENIADKKLLDLSEELKIKLEDADIEIRDLLNKMNSKEKTIKYIKYAGIAVLAGIAGYTLYKKIFADSTEIVELI